MDFRKENGQYEPMTVFSQAGLTDIIMLLLIFFLLTSSFVTNVGIQVNVPQADAGTLTDSRHIPVAITPDGTFYVNGEQVARGSLSGVLRSEHQRNPQGMLVIRADRDARVDDAVYVMNIGKALNMNIVMATERSN